MLKLDVVGDVTRGRYTGWYLVVKAIGEEMGFLIIISKENLFDQNGNLQSQITNEVYDLWFLTEEDVHWALENSYAVKWS